MPDPAGQARAIFLAALEAVEPGRLVRQALALEGGGLFCGGRRFDLSPKARVVVVGAGKAAAAMASAVEALLGERVSSGLILAVEGTQRPLSRLGCLSCAHPAPDERAVEGTRRLLEAVSGLSPDDLVIALWSGGGSSCLGLPVDGVSREEVSEATRLLLANHFQIQQVNQVRRVCLQAADGGVARAASPARVLALVLCDAAMADVASGPTMPGAFALDGVISGLRNWGVWEKLPGSVRAHLASLEGKDLRKGMDAAFRKRVYHVSVGDGLAAAEAALRKARELGYEAEVADQPLQWEARMAGTLLGRQLKALGSGHVLVAPGETTVAVKGQGRGGRNQELALAAALELAGEAGVALLSAGTDGVDGSSDAAGAVVTGETCAKKGDAAAARKALEDNDSHAFFLNRPERLVTGPTGTNVADLVVAVRG